VVWEPWDLRNLRRNLVGCCFLKNVMSKSGGLSDAFVFGQARRVEFFLLRRVASRGGARN
jgi:hypothetical protein